jgi:hypothetical protein
MGSSPVPEVGVSRRAGWINAEMFIEACLGLRAAGVGATWSRKTETSGKIVGGGIAQW